VLGVDFLVVWMARLALKRQRFHVWGSSLHRWRWLAILLALVPLAQLAVSTQTAQRFLYVDLDWWNRRRFGFGFMRILSLHKPAFMRYSSSRLR
jgi:hypothetical protein